MLAKLPPWSPQASQMQPHQLFYHHDLNRILTRRNYPRQQGSLDILSEVRRPCSSSEDVWAGANFLRNHLQLDARLSLEVLQNLYCRSDVWQGWTFRKRMLYYLPIGACCLSWIVDARFWSGLACRLRWHLSCATRYLIPSHQQRCALEDYPLTVSENCPRKPGTRHLHADPFQHENTCAPLRWSAGHFRSGW